MGRGGAQLGKALKGAGTAKAKSKKKVTKKEAVSEEVKLLGEYENKVKLQRSQQERLAMLAKENGALSRLSGLRNATEWKEAMRTFMRNDQDVEVNARALDYMRISDCNDGVVLRIVSHMEQLEIDFQDENKGYSQRRDALIHLYITWATKRRHVFDVMLEQMKRAFQREFKLINQIHIRNLQKRQDVEAAVISRENELRAETKQFYDTEREHIRSHNLENINALRVGLSMTIEELEHKFDQAHQNYVDNTRDRTKDFHELKEKDTMLSLEIERMIRRIEQCQRSIVLWRKKVQHNAKDSMRRNRTVRNEYMALRAHYRELKERMASFRDAELRQKTMLSMQNRETDQALSGKCTMADKLLTFSQMALRLESEREKANPFLNFKIINDEENEAENASNAAQVIAEPSPAMKKKDVDGLFQGCDALENYFRKFNKARLDTAAVRQLRNHMLDENTKLRAALKQYVEGINVNHDTIDKPNPLMIINGKVDIKKPSRYSRPGRKPYIVEGNNVLKQYHAHYRPCS